MREPVMARVFAVLLLATALDAYAIGPFPIRWLANACFVGLAALILLRRQLRKYLAGLRPAFIPLFLLVAWLAVITSANAVMGAHAVMPRGATSSYAFFLILRFASYLGFGAAALITCYATRRFGSRRVLEKIIAVALLVAVYALYVYLAQTVGLPEIPRNRLGTNGGEQVTEFSYAFHRAMGSFREPSHLAEWLVIPLIFSFTRAGTRGRLHSVALGSVMLLTGSLTGILSAALGLAVSMLTQGVRGIRTLVTVSVLLGLALLMFDVVVRGDDTSLVATLGARVLPLLEGGIAQSNRDYVYAFVESNPSDWLGLGLGNANLALTRYMGWDVVASFLSLYINLWYAGGVVALVLLLNMFFGPLLRLVRRYPLKAEDAAIVGAFCARLLSAAVHAEELDPLFGIVFGLSIVATRPGRTVAHALPLSVSDRRPESHHGCSSDVERAF